MLLFDAKKEGQEILGVLDPEKVKEINEKA